MNQDQNTGGVRCHDADACAMGQLPCPTPGACGCAAAPQAVQAEPFMWAIQDPGGGAYMDDGCVSSVREDVQAEVDGLNSGLDADDDPYQVVPVYLAAAPQAVQAAVPDGWKLIAVNPEFDNLMYWLDRCYEKGHLERCSDLIEPWLVFDYDSKTDFIAATPAHPAEGVPAQAVQPQQAMEALKAAMKADPEYAWSWHCAIWSGAHDEGLETGAANRAAARVMHMAFDCDTTKNANFHAAHLAATQPAAQGMDALDDTALLNLLQTESWDLRCLDVPTGGDDSEVHWQVIEHHMAAPHEREVGRAYSDDPREAIRNAIGNATNITAKAKQGGA